MDELFVIINSWIVSNTWTAALGCFLWGVVSVLLSPCHLASIPLIVAYVGGQNKIVQGKQAAGYAILFSTGLFITIAVVGFICAAMGRMLGDVGPYWTIGVGLILFFVAANMMGLSACSLPSRMFSKIRLQGYLGAFVLGLAYGVLSGTCTFGFIAPILAIITVQQQVFTGMILIVLFGIGHCLPIIIAGSSASIAQKMANKVSFVAESGLFQQVSGCIIFLLGIYFVVRPFMPAT